MKKGRWQHFYEKINDAVQEVQHEGLEPGMVAVPRDLLVDGVYDGKFKRANQEALASILGIQTKQSIKKDGKRETK